MRSPSSIWLYALVVGAAPYLTGCAQISQVTDPSVARITQAGKLRAGIGVVAPHWAVKDPATGELRGVAVDMARELAKRLNVSLQLVEYPSPPRVLDGVPTAAWDVGFLAVDPSRATLVDFAPPYLQIDATYLVKGNSPISAVEDADRAGIRIAVTAKSVEDIVLSKMLKQAQLHKVETIPAGFALLRAETVQLLALPRPAAIQFSTKLPGSRVLQGRFHTTSGAIAVPKGQAGLLSYVSEFTREAKASGIVQRSIDRNGVRGVQVAPSDR